MVPLSSSTALLVILTPSLPSSSSWPPLLIFTVPALPAMMFTVPVLPHSIVSVPAGVLLAGGAGLQVSDTLPPTWSIARPRASSEVPRVIADTVGGAAPGGPGGSSSLNTNRLPAGETRPRLTTAPPPLTAAPPSSYLVLSLGSPPSTYGRRGSPNSKPISTSSPTSGTNIAPL